MLSFRPPQQARAGSRIPGRVILAALRARRGAIALPALAANVSSRIYGLHPIIKRER
jgi:hypothetical protein